MQIYELKLFCLLKIFPEIAQNSRVFHFCFHFLPILRNTFDHIIHTLLISDSLASQNKCRTRFHKHLLERIQHRFPAGQPLLVLQTSASHKSPLLRLHEQISLQLLDRDQMQHQLLCQLNPSVQHITNVHFDKNGKIKLTCHQYSLHLRPIIILLYGLTIFYSKNTLF